MPTPAAPPSADPDWNKLRGRLVAKFPEFSEDDILLELVHARDAVEYVGTPQEERLELVEFMARYGLLVRAGRISPSDRLDPEKHASPRRR
ncbi:MAG TPA: hypothetical protein VHE57_05655 [Mycobacteriales bacterium]|nr:hypothetical protein [Mycobacteriales bacterium]